LVKFRRLLWSYWIVNIVLLCIIMFKTRFCLIVVVTDCKSCVLKRLKGIVHPPQRIASGDVTFVFIIKDLGHLTRKCIHLVIWANCPARASYGTPCWSGVLRAPKVEEVFHVETACDGRLEVLEAEVVWFDPDLSWRLPFFLCNQSWSHRNIL
jgi:hypothetical protein